MEQLKIGDLVRRDQDGDVHEAEGFITELWSNGAVRVIKLTKDYRQGYHKAGENKSCIQSREYQKFYLVSKYPAIKTKFLGGYIE